MANVNLETEIKGLGKVFYCVDSFDISCKAVLEKCDSIISMRDLAYAFMADAEYCGSWKSSSLCTNKSYVREGALVTPKQTILLSESLILKNPSAALAAHSNYLGARTFSEYYLPDLNVEELLHQIGKDNYCIASERSIPTACFEDYDETRWAFKDQAKNFGLFLKDCGVSSVMILSPRFRSNSFENPYSYSSAHQFTFYLFEHSGPFFNPINEGSSFHIDSWSSLKTLAPLRVRGIYEHEDV